MRLRIAVVFALWALTDPPAFGERTFPYTAYITADDVYVRSGPGKSYYPTAKLKTGDKVEVYRHDPGGWYAIRPVEGSFSWVSGRYLEVGEDDLATTTGDRVAARVGSQFSDIRDVIQVRLHRGEAVEVLGKEQFSGGPGAGTWYKIAPPSGEFRWVFGKYVDPDFARSGVRKAPAGRSPLARHGESDAAEPATAHGGTASLRHAAAAVRPPLDKAAPAQRPSASGGPGEPTRRSSSADPTTPSATAADAVEDQEPVRYTNRFVEPARDPAGSPTYRRISPDEFQNELEAVDMELSIMLAEEPTVWQFDELVVRAQALLTEAETALERGRARLLASKIEQSEDIKRRHDVVNAVHLATERHNGQLAGLSRARGAAAPQADEEDRFDGVGRLVRVVPAKLGAPQYALVDDKGGVRCYVTPSPGLNIHYYLGRRIGVSGVRGHVPEGGARQVTAKHISVLDGRRLR